VILIFIKTSQPFTKNIAITYRVIVLGDHRRSVIIGNEIGYIMEATKNIERAGNLYKLNQEKLLSYQKR